MRDAHLQSKSRGQWTWGKNVSCSVHANEEKELNDSSKPRSQGWIVITHLRDLQSYEAHHRRTLYHHIQALTRDPVFEADTSAYTARFLLMWRWYLHTTSPSFLRSSLLSASKICAILLFVFLVDKLCPYVHHSKKNKILKQDKLIIERGNSAFTLSTQKKWGLQKTAFKLEYLQNYHRLPLSPSTGNV